MQALDRKTQFEGALLGLALGDALGAPHEGGVLERALWRIIGTTRDGKRRWTDDTQMALDLAESLIGCGAVHEDDMAQRFARSYRWSRGYGPGTARVLGLIRGGMDWRVANRRVFPEGSLGNGGAMRAPVVGLFYHQSLEATVVQARATAAITHAHPCAQEAAAIVALATAMTMTGHSPEETLAGLAVRIQYRPLDERLAVAREFLGSGNPSPRDVRRRLGSSVTARDSCVTAVYVALENLDGDFSEMLDFVAACGGDVDTLGAMAGAIWGARHGSSALPGAMLDGLEDADGIRGVAQRLYEVAVSQPAA